MISGLQPNIEDQFSMALGSDSGTHVYRPSNKARLFFVVLGCFQLLGGAWLLSIGLHGWLKPFDRSASGSDPLVIAFPIIIACFLVISGALSIRIYWKRILKLSVDAVEVEFLYGARSLKYSAIKGRRSKGTQYGRCTVLVPSEQHLRKMVIKEGFIVDDFYKDWLSSIPDLDLIDKAKRKADGKLHWWED